jgi:hypothetical protein
METPTAVLAPAAVDVAPIAAVPRGRPGWPGILSFIFGMLTAAGLVTGLVLVTADQYLAATWTAWIASGVGALAVLVGLVAAVGRFGRAWAVTGLVLGLVANPPVLTRALDAIGGLWA